MSLKVSLGRILGTVTGMALSGPGGAVLGGLAGGLVDAVLPSVSETVGEVLGEVGAEMLTASVEWVQARLASDEIQPLDSDLQIALRDAFCEALYDIGGEKCFADEWKSERDVPDGVVYPRTPEGHRLWHNKDPLAQQVCECFNQMVEAANDGSLFAPAADELEAQVQTYLNANTLAQVRNALFRQTLAPYLSSLWELPGFLQHLRRTLVPRLLVHLSNLLKQRTPAWRDFNRLLLEQLQAQVQAVANSQQQLSHQLTQIRERLDAILAQEPQDHESSLTEWANGLAELLAAMGQLEQRLDEKLEDVLTSVVEGNREVVERLISLTRVMTKVREGVERTESKVDQVIYLLTQREANLNALLESIVADVRGARLPNFVMQNERLITEAHPTPVMLRERQSNYFERHRLFAGRAKEIERIHDFLSSQPSGYIFVTGASGFGKTALLANVVAPHRAQYIWYFLNQLDGTNNRRDFLRQMCEQMLAYYQMPVRSQYDLPEHADHLEALYARLLRMPLVQANQPLVLVIDGVDEAANNFISDLYIPRHLPAGKFIIFSARETGRNYLEELGLPVDHVLTINLEQLDEAGIQALLRAADATTWADDSTLVSEVLRVSEGDPFYLHELVQDIASGQITAEQITLKPAGLTAYLDGWWQQVVTALRHDRDLRTLMGLLMVTLGPLPSTDLFRLDEELEWGFDDILKPVRRFIIIEQSHHEDTYALCHPRFRDYLANHKLRGKAQSYRSQLLTYCGGWQQHLSRYALQHYAAHLAEAAQWDELHTLVATGDERIEWAEARHALEGSYAGYLEDLGLAWAYADEIGVTNPAEAVGKQVRYALIKSSIHTIAGNIHPDLLIAVVENGIWTAAQALAHVRQMPETDEQVEALTRLAPYLSKALLDEALSIARTIKEEWAQAKALIGLASHLPEKLVSPTLREALEVARRVKEEQTRARILTELAAHLPKSLKEEVLRDALEATLATSNKQTRVKMLVELAAHLPENLKEEALYGALEATRATSNKYTQAKMLVELAAHLPKNLKEETLHEALEVAQTIEVEQTQVVTWMIKRKQTRVETLVELAAHLPENLKEEALHKALVAVQATSNPKIRANKLVELAPHLPASLLDTALHEALAAARAIEGEYQEYTRASVLTELAPHLPESLFDTALREALAAAQAIEEEDTRVRMLAKLVPHLLKSLKEEVLREILETPQTIESEDDRADALAELAPETWLRQGLNAARMSQDETWQAVVLTKLVPRLAELGYPEEALAVAQKLPEEGKGINIQAEVLRHLAEHLPEPLVRQALASTQRKEDRHNDWVMAELALQLAKLGHPQEAVEIVRTIKSNECRAEALVLLTLDFWPEVSLLQEAVTTIEFVKDSNWRAKQLPKLVRRLAERGLPHEALEAVLKIKGTSERAQALTNLVTHLPGSLLHAALQATQNGKKGKEGKELATAMTHLAASKKPEQVLELEKLAPHLPEALLRQVLTVVRGVQAQTRLALYLPKQTRIKVLRNILAQARIIGDRDKQRHTQEVLLPQLAKLGHSQNAWRAAWVIRLAELGHLQESLTAARAIESSFNQVYALAEVALYQKEPSRNQVLNEALATAQAISDKDERQLALAMLALRLAELGFPDKALAVVRNLPEYRRKTGTRLGRGVRRGMKQIVSHKAGMLEKLVPHLSETLLGQALELAQTIEDQIWRVRTMVAIVYQLVELGDLEKALVVARQVVEVIQAIREEVHHLVPALEELALRLAKLGAPFEALAVAQQLPEQSKFDRSNSQAEVLRKLVPHLPERALPQALEVAKAISDENWRARTMEALVPRLAGLDSLKEVLAVTQALDDENVRERTMVVLAPRLAEQGYPEEALWAIVQATEDEDQQANMIAQLAPHLSETLLRQALEIVQAIESTSVRVRVLSRLAPHLSQELQHDVLDAERELSKRLGPPEMRSRAIRPPVAVRQPSKKKRESVLAAFRFAKQGHPQKALAAMRRIGYVEHRTDQYSLWRAALHTLARDKRQGLLQDLGALAPVIEVLGKLEAVEEAVQAVQDVGRWWP